MASATTSKAPTLPSSLSPHVVTVLSPDLVELLKAASLPPLHHILQSYSPLPLVTTRTTALTPVSHQAFHLRFSDLDQIAQACREDEETRSSRFIDWIGSRIARRAGKWVEDIHQFQQQNGSQHIHSPTPWWAELRRCVEGEWVPSRSEGWNHPVAVIYAVSTMGANPLQAVTNLYSRPLDLPSWVDPTILRYILIVHPTNSPLNPDECNALYNAVKKQYNLHVHLLHLSLLPAPKPIPIIPLPPQLPPSQTSHGNAHPNSSHSNAASISGTRVPDTSELLMTESDAQSTGKFVREFLTQSLVPWMEKCVIEWNEAYSNNKRLPTRLFSSTRRLFGSSATPATPITAAPSSSGYTPSSPTSTSTAFAGPPPPQQRRLAEFATFLGDWRLATSVWESMRKEGKGGAAILPLLLAPSTGFVNYAAQALAPVFGEEPSATALMNAIICAVRWDAGVPDFILLGGERWLVWAASTADEAATALLLGHAAHLSRHRGAKRRAALWYVVAAHRLEKCGIKALTAHFLDEAYAIYNSDPVKSLLSPSYADAEQWPVDIKVPTRNNFPIILTNIEHSLGRIKYSSGDTENAVKLFLGLLRYSRMIGGADTDAVVIDDFKQALEHLESIHPADKLPSDLVLPISFCVPSDSKIRLGIQSEGSSRDEEIWENLQSRWSSSREKGKGKLEPPSAEVGQPFWLDVVLENPLEASVTLKNFSLSFTRPNEDDAEVSGTLALSEVIDEIFLPPKDRRTVPVSITPQQPGPLCISEATYLFISNFPVKEFLSIHGKRLHATVQHLRNVEYAPSRKPTLTVRQGGLTMDAQLLNAEEEDDEIILLQGEVRRFLLRLKNRGAMDIGEVWMIVNDTVSVWVDNDASATEDLFKSESPETAVEELPFSNQMQSHTPLKLDLQALYGHSTLPPGYFFDVPILLHASDDEDTKINILLTYSNSDSFFFTRLYRDAEVTPILSTTSSITPTPTRPHLFALRLEVESITDEVEVNLEQISAVGTEWIVQSSPRAFSKSTLPPRQISKASFQVAHYASKSSKSTTKVVMSKFSDFLLGKGQSSGEFPPTTLQCSHFAENAISFVPPHLQHMIISARRRHYLHQLTTTFPTIPSDIIRQIFPLYTPHSLDVIVFWRIPSSRQHGFIVSCDLQIGVGHGLLQNIIEQASQTKGKSIYAETKREHELLLQHFSECEWNRETDPLVVSVKAEKPVIDHDFTKGPCLIPVEFTLRNYSPTNPSRYLLRLPGVRATPHLRHSFAVAYSGQLTHHGLILPFERKTIKALARTKSPGQFSLGGWRLEVEVGVRDVEEETTAPESVAEWRILARYLQQGTSAENGVLVRDVSSSD